MIQEQPYPDMLRAKEDSKNRFLRGARTCLIILAVWIEHQILLYSLPAWSSTMILPPVWHTILMEAEMYSGNFGVLRWSPDGSLLALGASNGALACWNVHTHKTQWSVRPSGQGVSSLAWSQDGNLLAVAFNDKHVEIWNVHEKEPVVSWEKVFSTPRMLNFSGQHRITVASSKPYLLFGTKDDNAPTAKHPGYWIATWSPTKPELATLDPDDPKKLMIWQE